MTQCLSPVRPCLFEGPWCVDSTPSSAAYIHQWIGSAVVQIIACHLFGAKPSSKPMLGYYQLEPKEQTSVKFKHNANFSFKRMHLKISPAEWRPCCPGEMSWWNQCAHGFPLVFELYSILYFYRRGYYRNILSHCAFSAPHLIIWHNDEFQCRTFKWVWTIYLDVRVKV